MDERAKSRAIRVVLATIFLDTVGLGIIVPVCVNAFLRAMRRADPA